MNDPSTDSLTGGVIPAGEAPAPTVTFAEMGLRPELLRALTDMGFAAPMDVQARTLPVVRTGRDVMVQSRTGSGKTAAFGIPIIDRIVNPDDKFVQAIILLPTRELALQVAAELARISAHSGATVVPVYGGAPMGRQIEQLRAGGQIVCGTPGRVLDHLRRGTLKLDRVRCAVLDECDEMLSMGFQEDIEAILERTPAERQTLLFSATVPEGIRRIAKRFMRNPEHLKLSADFVGVHEIKHIYYSIPGANRDGDLQRILDFENPGRAIIFCNTRDETSRVAEFLRGKGHEAEAISSDLSQSDRERVMGLMRAGSIRFLVATDVAARGIDLENLSHVFNYSFPDSPEVYIHRTGRTGRAGRHGTAVSLIGPTEVGAFYYLKLLYKIKPEERSLPSEIEIRSKREGEAITTLRTAFAQDPGPEWRALARRLVSSVDAERLVGALLRDRSEPSKTAARVPAPVGRAKTDSMAESTTASAAQPSSINESAVHSSRETRPELPARDARPPATAGRVPSRFGPRPQTSTPITPPRARFDGPAAAQKPSPASAPLAEAPVVSTPLPPAAPAPAAEIASPMPDATAPEFWDVWREGDDGENRHAPEAAPAVSPNGATGETRLYLNLGRKDRAQSQDIIDLVRDAVGREPLSVELMNTHTYLNVPADMADTLVAILNQREVNGRRLSAEPARPRRR